MLRFDDGFAGPAAVGSAVEGGGCGPTLGGGAARVAELRRARVSEPSSRGALRSEPGVGALEQEHVAPDAVEPADPLAHADQPETAVEVEHERGAVLGEDACLQGPDPGALRFRDQMAEKRAAEAAAADVRVDVDAHVGDAFVAAAVRVRRERDPPDYLAAVARDVPVRGHVRRVPGLPGRHLGLEGRVAGRDPRRVDPCDLRPVGRPEVADVDARSRRDSGVVVEEELGRVRAEPDDVHLVLPLPADPRR